MERSLLVIEYLKKEFFEISEKKNFILPLKQNIYSHTSKNRVFLFTINLLLLFIFVYLSVMESTATCDKNRETVFEYRKIELSIKTYIQKKLHEIAAVVK